MSRLNSSDKAYVALRSLSEARLVSEGTKQKIKRAIARINKEAMQDSLRQTTFLDHQSSAGD